ncbi:MAG: lipoprotein signal peptidase [Cognaticolwellia sp.]|jgi:lipoprotein signal peptidase
MEYGWQEFLALGLAIACQAVVWLQYHKRKVPLGKAGPVMALLFFVVGARAAGVAWGMFERSAQETDLSELVFHIIALNFILVAVSLRKASQREKLETKKSS